MKKEKKYTICTLCNISHYDNCESCFGFGVYSDKPGDIVTAMEAMYGRPLERNVIHCSECGSRENGVTIYP